MSGVPGRFMKSVVLGQLMSGEWQTASDLYASGFYSSKDLVSSALAILYEEGKVERRYDPSKPRRVWQYRLVLPEVFE